MKMNQLFSRVTTGMRHSVGRFPLSVLFLIVSTILTGLMIERSDLEYTQIIFTLLVGTMLTVVAQMIYERFFTESSQRYLLMGGATLLTMGYYFTIGFQSDFDLQAMVKTSVALFALFITFTWIPSIKNERVAFHQSFLSAFKAFFTTVIFSLVLVLGVSAIITAINLLLFNLDPDVYAHLFNLIGLLFSPIYFLSLTPLFPIEGRQANENLEEEGAMQSVQHAFTVPKFLDVLISYIIIPLTGIYTVILVLYVLLNISGDFWTDNLLEPLLVSYAVVVIVVYVLACNVDNRFTQMFRLIFPKILVPIVIFQTIASILKIGEMGITHGRYFVILFGIFAAITGILFSWNKPKYNGYMAAVLLILSTLSIVPPVDAFTISKNHQINLLEEKLIENKMLEGTQIIPSTQVSDGDRILITNLMMYLQNLDYTDEVDFLPNDFQVYNDFRQVFGFDMTYPGMTGTDFEDLSVFYYLEEEFAYMVPLAGYDVLINQSLYHIDEDVEVERVEFTVEETDYIFEKSVDENGHVWRIIGADEAEIFTLDSQQIFEQVQENINVEGNISEQLTIEEATILLENDQVEVRVIVNALEETSEVITGEFDFFIHIKE